MSSNGTCRIKVTRLSIALIVLATIRLTASAQAPQSQYDRGTPPQHTAGVSAIGSYISADIGTINLSNGSLNFRLPLGNVGGRGFWLPLTLNYSSKLWSGSRGQVFVPEPFPGHNAAIAFASYNDRGAGPYNGVAPGWTVGAAPFLKARGVGINSINNPPCTDFSWVVVKLTLVLPDKGEIELRDETYNGAPISPTTGSDGCRSQDGANHGKRWHATDGSGIVFINDNNNGVVNGDLAGVVILADGTRYHLVNTSSGTPPPTAYVNRIGLCDWVRDRNGNKIAIQYPTSTRVEYIDQLGRVTAIESDVADPQPPYGPLALLVTLPGYNGAVRYYKVKTASMNQNYRSDLTIAIPVRVGGDTGEPGTVLFPGGYAGIEDRIDDISVLTQLILPDNRALTFKYNEFGEVAEVQMPTAGKVQYDYEAMAYNASLQRGMPSGNSLAVEVVATGIGGGGNVHAVDRAAVARRTYPDGNTSNPPEGSWTYSYKISKTQVKCTVGSTTLLDEWHYFLAAQRFLSGSTANGADGTGYSLWSTGVEQRSEMVNGAAVLSATEQDWLQRITIQSEGKWTTGHSIEEVANDNRVTHTRKYLDDGSFSKVDTFYDQTLGDNNHVNNPTRVDEYDLDHTTLKRRTTISYFTDYTGTGVNTLNILSLPHDQAVFEPTDLVNPRSLTTYEYDTYTADEDNALLQTYEDYSSIPGRDQTYDTSYLTRGNPTKVMRMVNGSSSITSYTRYDVLGNVVTIKDPRTNVTTISYLDDFGLGANPGFNSGGHSTYALPTKITSPPPNPGEPQHIAYSQYDFSTGLLTGFKDRNGTITQTFYNDAFDRPTQIIAALGVQKLENHTAMYYAPRPNPFLITLTNNDVLTAKDQVGIDDGNLRSWTKTDGFGRTIESWTHAPDELYQGNAVSGDIVVKTNYDGLGRTKQTSSPFRPAVLSESAQYIATEYDLVGRVTTVTTPDNAKVSTFYDGPRVLVKDQADKERLSKTDGLGRLSDVWEIRSADTVTGTEAVTFPSHPEVQNGYRTKYTYDALDDLTEAKQQIGTTGTTQTRTFNYDSLKRLTSAFNPESGTISYSYDNNSNLVLKTDSRVPAVTTTYDYDALNRVKSRIYSGNNTPAVVFRYDAQSLPANYPPSFNGGSSIGRLVAVTYGGASAGNYTGYDQLGRVTSSYQQTDAQNYGFTYVYNLASEMTRERYPSGNEIRTTYDTAGRVSDVKRYINDVLDKTYASQFSYAAHGAAKSLQLGNGKWEHTNFNSRLQPLQIGLGTSPTNSSVLQLDYAYGTTTNNGNVISQTITAPGLTVNQCYGYDSLNRLSTAEERSGGTICSGTQQWKQAFSYDRYGNRNFDVANTTVNVLGPNPTISKSTNRFTAGQNYGYDNAGNLTSDPTTPLNGIVYDAENRQTEYTKSNQPTNSYSYDGDGRRVKKIDGSGTTVFVYNVLGQLIAEYTSGAPTGSGTSYLTSDHLGSTRVVMKSDGTITRHDYLPFGEEIQAGIGGRTAGQGYVADNVRQKFTQKERDNESGLDYFLARYYSSVQGRFTSPDEFNGGPVAFFAVAGSSNPTFYADLTNPQSLSKYQYCLNNPLRYIDPDGHDYRRVEELDDDGKRIVRYVWDRNYTHEEGDKNGVAAGYRYIDRNGNAIQLWGSNDKDPTKEQDHGYHVITPSKGGELYTPGVAEPPKSFLTYGDTRAALVAAGYEKFLDLMPEHAGGTDFAKRGGPTEHVTLFGTDSFMGFINNRAPVDHVTFHNDPHSPVDDTLRHIIRDTMGIPPAERLKSGGRSIDLIKKFPN